MVMKSIKLIGIILLISNVVHTDIDFTNIKGLYTVFRTKKYLSPIHGFAWWKSGQIEELYRYDDPDHKTVQLIQELFYLNPGDEVTFAPTILPTKIGFYITPRALGELLATLDPYVENQSLSPSDEQHLEKALETILGSELNFSERVAASKIRQEELRTELTPDIQKARTEATTFSKKAVELESEKKAKDKAVADLKQEVATLRGQRNNLKRNEAKDPNFISK